MIYLSKAIKHESKILLTLLQNHQNAEKMHINNTLMCTNKNFHNYFNKAIGYLVSVVDLFLKELLTFTPVINLPQLSSFSWA